MIDPGRAVANHLTHVAALLCALLAVWAPGSDALFWLDARLGDLLLRAEARQRPTPPEIVIVGIDQNSLDDPQMLDAAGSWPWPRSTHGELLDTLGAARPRVIAFDLIFSEPDIARPHSDAYFAEALRRTPAFLPLVVAPDGVGSRLANLPPGLGVTATLAAQADAELPLIAPKALPADVWQTGLINFREDPDGTGRSYWIDYPANGWTLPSLPARMARALGAPVPHQDAIALHWYAQPFRRISYADLYLDGLRSAPQRQGDVAGKIVVIGATAPGLHDFRPTPGSAVTSGPDILATTVANLLADDWLRPAPRGLAEGTGVLLIAMMAWALTRHAPPVVVGSGLAVATVGVVATAYALLGANILWRPFSALIAAWIYYGAAGIAAHLQERRRREDAVRMFGRFLDPHVVEQLTGSRSIDAAQVGQACEVTVLFSDIRGFTSLSETRRPEEIVALLNRYFDLQVDAVFRTGGTLDKFIGDAVMAFWGAPVAQPDHALRAVRAALDMQQRLLAFRAELGEDGAQFDVGIGLHSGEAVVGFLGSSKRLEYTAIGDTVNLASRIEGQTKGIARILVSEATRAACVAGEGEAGTLEFVDHGEFHVKGRQQSVRLFEPIERPAARRQETPP